MESKATAAAVNKKTGAATANFDVKTGDEVNARAGVFASTNGTPVAKPHAPITKGAIPVTKGISGAVNAKGHGLSVEHQHTEHRGSSTTVAGQANLFTAAGNSAALGVSHVPKSNMTTMNASGTANLYSSPSGNLNVNATASANLHTSGPFRGKNNINTGFNVDYKF